MPGLLPPLSSGRRAAGSAGRSATRVLIAVLLAAHGSLALAETYRWKDPRTGRMVISDQPPPAGIGTPARRAGAAAPADAGGSVPYAVRQAMRDFPVRLYTAPQCKTECQEARQVLQGRGIPYREESVATRAAVEELKRLAGQDAVPVLQVGQEVLVGMQLSRWNQTLDLAGYSKTAYPGYRPPAPPVESLMPPAEEPAAPAAEGAGAPAAAGESESAR